VKYLTDEGCRHVGEKSEALRNLLIALWAGGLISICNGVVEGVAKIVKPVYVYMFTLSNACPI
jgi:hypothetical protein